MQLLFYGLFHPALAVCAHLKFTCENVKPNYCAPLHIKLPENAPAAVVKMDPENPGGELTKILHPHLIINTPIHAKLQPSPAQCCLLCFQNVRTWHRA
jgi:hypothetical protein